jgi:hypothetical protein
MENSAADSTVEAAQVSRLLPENSSTHRKALPMPPDPRRGSNGSTLRPLPPYPLDDSPSNWSNIRTPAPNPQPERFQRNPVAPVGLSAREDVSNQHNVLTGQYSRPAGFPQAKIEHQQLNYRIQYGDTLGDNPYAPLMYQKREEEMKPPLPVRPTITPQTQEADNATTLTLIRRDPASSAQWNVATIVDLPVFEVTSDGRRNSTTGTRIRKPGQPLYIDVATPGYAKFADLPTLDNSVPSLTDSSSLDGSVQQSNTFQRRMWMEGSTFEPRPRGHRKAKSSDHSLLSRPSFDARSSSDFSVQSNATTLVNDPFMQSISVDGERKRSRNRGYTLMSPWNGRCEFSSGIGNSLKCRHSLSPGTGASPSPVTVSELRFNLPGGGPLASQIPTTPGPDTEKRRSRFLHPSRHLRLSSSMDSTRSQSDFGGSYEGSMLDLSLGQERAGGGFAGKQAKLGKLIIDDEGLKMMDLLVAANLGLWWRAYEKG